MKNLLMGTLSMFLIVSCEKQNLAPSVADVKTEITALESLKKNVTVKDEMLVFTNEESYKNAIEYLISLESDGKDYASYWDSEIGFNSLNQQKTEKELDAMGIYDAVFAELLNGNQEIQIGGQVFKINTVDGTMIVKDVVSEQMETFSTNDSYFDVKDRISVKGARAGCAKDKVDFSPGGAGSWSQVDSKISYQKAGIYFSLLAKVTQSSRPNGRSISLRVVAGSTYTKNKNSVLQQTIDPEFKNGGSGSYSYRPYFNTRQLKQFDFEATFGYNYIGHGSALWTRSISCD